MFRTFFVEFVFPLLLFLFVRSLLRNLFSGLRSYRAPQAASRPTPVPSGGELKKDPVCGTYVSAAIGIHRQVNGEQVYFCSKECADRFAAHA